MPAARRKILDVGPETVSSLPGACASCCFWESTGPGAPGDCPGPGVKERWIRNVLEHGFSPGKLIQSEGTTLAYVQLAPARMVPRLTLLPYPRPTDDSVYITCVYVLPDVRGRGLGRLLLDSVNRTLYRRRSRTLETHGLPAAKGGPPGPRGFFSACGFREVTGHLTVPLMRLELRSLAPVQEGIQSLLERLPLPAMSRAPLPGTGPPVP